MTPPAGQEEVAMKTIGTEHEDVSDLTEDRKAAVRRGWVEGLCIREIEARHGYILSFPEGLLIGDICRRLLSGDYTVESTREFG